MRTRIYILLILASFLYIGCGKSDKKSEETTVETATEINNHQHILVTRKQFTNAKMELGTINEQSFDEVIKVTGKIDVPPKNKAFVSIPMGGYIKQTDLLVGDKVKKGQLLVTLENPEFVTLQQNYLEVSKQLEYLKSEYERQKTLFTENITSKKNYLKAESEYQTAQARYSGLQKQLQVVNISPTRVASGNIVSTIGVYAPINGIISEMNVVKGAFVSPATEIMHIIDNDHIHVELTVFEKDVMKLQKGQSVEFTLPENSLETYKAHIHLIGASINKNRTVDVHAHVKDEEKHRFLTGMFVDANIIVASKKQKALPNDAVVEVDGHFYVLKLIAQKDNLYTFEKIHVEVENRSKQHTAIKNIEDFKLTDKILITGAFNLINDGDTEGGHDH